jgi:hypothetical protein
MFSEAYYLIRSRADGSYLGRASSCWWRRTDPKASASFLLLFREHFDALSYLNTHAAELADRFSVESIPGTQIDPLLKRWSFTGIGVVQDPLIPRVEFLTKGST